MPVDKIRDARRAYFGACSYIDSNVGKLLQTLEDTGLIDDTIIVFSGDHGDMLGERGLWYKMHWFEMAARVPLLISAPGQFGAGRVSASVSTADLLPTFVELAGGSLEPGLPLDGRSLVPHLQGQGGHDEVFGEYMAEGTISPLMMIRRGAYKFIYSEDDPCLLFDVHNDPRELEELSQSPQHRQLFDEFLAEATGQMEYSGDPPTGAREPAAPAFRRPSADHRQAEELGSPAAGGRQSAIHAQPHRPRRSGAQSTLSTTLPKPIMLRGSPCKSYPQY